MSRTVDRIEASAREHRSSVSLVDCPWATGTEVLSPREPRSWRVGSGDQSLPCTLRFRLTVRGIEHLRELPERTGPTYPEANSEKYNVPVNRKMFVVSCHRSGALPIGEKSGNDDQDEEEGRTLEEGWSSLQGYHRPPLLFWLPAWRRFSLDSTCSSSRFISPTGW